MAPRCAVENTGNELRVHRQLLHRIDRPQGDGLVVVRQLVNT